MGLEDGQKQGKLLQKACFSNIIDIIDHLFTNAQLILSADDL